MQRIVREIGKTNKNSIRSHSFLQGMAKKISLNLAYSFSEDKKLNYKPEKLLVITGN